MQLADAIAIAYCQPNVGAYFNFHLTDERDLAGWQSGVYWADGTPKAAYQALHNITDERQRDARSTARRSSQASRHGRGRAAARDPAPDLEPQGRIALGLRRHGHVETTNPAKVQVGYGLADLGSGDDLGAGGASGDGQVAPLIGLDSRLAYRVWVTAVGDDGQRAQADGRSDDAGPVAHPTVAVGTPTRAHCSTASRSSR